MFIYHDKTGDVRFYSEGKIKCQLDFIEKNLSEQEIIDLQNINFDRKVIDGKIVIVNPEAEIDNIKDIKDLKKYLKSKK